MNAPRVDRLNPDYVSDAAKTVELPPSRVRAVKRTARLLAIAPPSPPRGLSLAASGARRLLGRSLSPRAIARMCVGLALIFSVAALVTGLRGAPDPSLPATVGTALVFLHAAVALGGGALSFGLLRMAERLLAVRPGDDPVG